MVTSNQQRTWMVAGITLAVVLVLVLVLYSPLRMALFGKAIAPTVVFTLNCPTSVLPAAKVACTLDYTELDTTTYGGLDFTLGTGALLTLTGFTSAHEIIEYNCQTTSSCTVSMVYDRGSVITKTGTMATIGFTAGTATGPNTIALTNMVYYDINLESAVLPSLSATVQVTGREICTDGVDNDGDGSIDCKDTDCATDAACVVVTSEAGFCTDLIDNDADGFTDCKDTDCATDAACVVAPVCGNRVVEAGETCDGGTLSCKTAGYSGTQACAADCLSWETCVASEFCGDNLVNGLEACDDGKTVTESCTYGSLSCTVCSATCQLVAGATSYCGDAIIDTINGEACDGTAIPTTATCPAGTTGTPGCTTTCALDTSSTYCATAVTDTDGDGVADGDDLCPAVGTSATVASNGCLRGDTNADGVIARADAVLVLRHTTGTTTLTSAQQLTANVDCTISITRADAVLILRYTTGTITTFPLNAGCPA